MSKSLERVHGVVVGDFPVCWGVGDIDHYDMNYFMAHGEGVCVSKITDGHIEAETTGRHFVDDIFKCIFLNENTSISINISLKFVPEGRINNIQALVQIMAWRWLGDKHYLNQWW